MTMAPSSVFLPTLPGRYYTEPAIFEQEKREIFEKQWLYVCRAEDVPAPGRFVRATVGNENVIWSVAVTRYCAPSSTSAGTAAPRSA
jgi:hypothetical protein